MLEMLSNGEPDATAKARDKSQGQQQQLEQQQLVLPAFDPGLYNTGTGGADRDNSLLGMDNRNLFSLLDDELLTDAMTDDMATTDDMPMTDDMSDFGHLMSLTVGLIKPTTSARDKPPQAHQLTSVWNFSTDARILSLNLRPTRRLFRQTRPLSPNIIRCNAALQ